MSYYARDAEHRMEGSLVPMRHFWCVSALSSLLLLLVGCSRDAEYYMNSGKQAAAAGHDSEAILNFRKVLQKDPQSGAAFLQLGLAFQRQLNFTEAYSSLKQAAVLLPSSEDASVRFADLCLNIHVSDPSHPRIMYEQVRNIADQLLAKNQQSLEGLRLDGNLALLDKRFDYAVETFRKAAAVNPEHLGVVLPLARSLVETGQAVEAERLALQLIVKDKTAEAAYDLLYRLYQKENRIAEAENILRRKVQSNPGSGGAHLQLAGHYAGRKEFPRMEEALRPLLDDPKKFPQARLQAGDLYRAAGKLDAAEKRYQDGLSANSGDRLSYQKRLLEIWAKQGKRDDVTKLVEAALRENPADEDLKAAKANLLVSTNNPDNLKAAILLFRELVKAKPGDIVRQLELSRASLLNGELDLAKGQLTEVLRRMPSSIPVRAMLADVSLRKRDYPEALRYADEILQAQPQYPGARLVRSASLMGLGRFKDARAELQKLSATQSQSRAAQLQLSTIDLAQGSAKDAENSFQKLHKSEPGDLRALEGLVQAQVGQSRSDTALLLIQEELSKTPDSVELRVLLARTAAQSGNVDLAIKQYQQLVERNRGVTDWYLPLGEALRARGDYPSALAQFEAARRLAPKDVRFVVSVAAVEILMGKKAAARESLRQALILQPGDPFIMNNLAYMMVETGENAEEAQKLVQNALKKYPEEPNFLDTQASIYQKLGQNGNALRVFQYLVRQYPENPGFRYHLAGSLAKTGDHAEARKALNVALGQKPAPRLDSEIRQLLSTLN